LIADGFDKEAERAIKCRIALVVAQRIITRKGQIVIPVSLRRKYGLRKGSRVQVHEEGGRIVVQPLTPECVEAKLDRLYGALRGLPLVQDLAEERALLVFDSGALPALHGAAPNRDREGADAPSGSDSEGVKKCQSLAKPPSPPRKTPLFSLRSLRLGAKHCITR